MAPPVIQTRLLGKRFGPVEAVRDLDLTVAAGEMFGLVGPDGAGKSTTIRMLCGIVPPSSGEARVLGYDLRTEAEKAKSGIGYLSQRFSLYGDLTVDENLEFFAEIHRIRDYRTRREELLAFTRLTPFRRRLAERLSGGMRQKLALACTLIHRPRLLLLDEPTTGVDPVSRRDFWKILSSLLKSEITIVMSTPYLDEAERCSRVGLMDRGRLLAADTPQELKSRLTGTVVEIHCRRIREARRVLAASPAARDVQMFGDRLNVVVDEPAAAVPVLRAALAGAGIELDGWRAVPPSLENVFMTMAAGQ